ncbi:hypothetical protein HYH02_006666 [Chlamydomonas schloesseri]|uniref:Uncharacterized protein n=1 Tax=Chlamydomonas schloesseri TaxID=2026947 RepID=A0A835T6V1_9CHLO|nr:hypothetical protein HYH02_006666 [Chlamydomonas schloesseri]|eukprot:KAG2432681.1 hypothetical protein HYH02_006666 [Chlamydomonas schloesseri]
MSNPKTPGIKGQKAARIGFKTPVKGAASSVDVDSLCTEFRSKTALRVPADRAAKDQPQLSGLATGVLKPRIRPGEDACWFSPPRGGRNLSRELRSLGLGGGGGGGGAEAAPSIASLPRALTSTSSATASASTTTAFTTAAAAPQPSISSHSSGSISISSCGSGGRDGGADGSASSRAASAGLAPTPSRRHASAAAAAAAAAAPAPGGIEPPNASAGAQPLPAQGARPGAHHQEATATSSAVAVGLAEGAGTQAPHATCRASSGCSAGTRPCDGASLGAESVARPPSAAAWAAGHDLTADPGAQVAGAGAATAAAAAAPTSAAAPARPAASSRSGHSAMAAAAAAATATAGKVEALATRGDSHPTATAATISEGVTRSWADQPAATQPPLQQQQALGSVQLFSPVKAGRSHREKLGADVVLTPVRRSARTSQKPTTPISALLEMTNFAFVNNAYLNPE